MDTSGGYTYGGRSGSLLAELIGAIGSEVQNGILDLGSRLRIPSVQAPFVNGTESYDSGYLIDAATEYARTYIILPNSCTTIVKIVIYGRTVVTEAHEMHLEVIINAGAENEAYTTEVVSVANADSATNIAADDVVTWTLTSSNDADIGHMVGGDSLEIKVIYESTVGDDCATNAYLRNVIVYFGT